MYKCIVFCISKRSRPTRARGLKPCIVSGRVVQSLSRPTRARGLKLAGRAIVLKPSLVAPHAGAWIETSRVIYAIR